MDDENEARSRRRASYQVRVYRADVLERMDADGVLRWEHIPMDERAAFVWQLSQEVYALAQPDGSVESGLPRSIVRVVRS